MRNNLKILTTCVVLMATVGVWGAQNKITFNDQTRYSQLIINSNLYHYHCNTSKVGGLGKYDASTQSVGTGEYTNKSDGRGFDYVPGLVLKATLEACAYYQGSDLNDDAYSWYKSVEKYGNDYYDKSHNGESLDDLNACKIYFGLYDLAKEGTFADATTASNCQTAKTNTLSGLSTHNSTYAIKSATSQAFSGDETYTGGWFHKSTYENQLWCDGQYMGPALLAMMVADGKNISGSAAGDWAIIMKQFNMCWNRLWDSDKELLYHAFSADPTSTQTTGWADHNDTYATNTHYGVSSEFWGRAEGWYFFALVDVLEQMQKAGKTGDSDYNTLLTQLEAVADGLLDRQDATTGCWCQLLQYSNGEIPTGCSTANYIESSCTAIFTACYLKGIRLGLLDKSKYETAAKKAYQGFVNNFIVQNSSSSDDGGNAYSLINCCASAGLDADRDGSAKYYLAENTKKDTQVITNYTEGKVLGAFIMAAVEYEKAYLPIDGGCNCLKVTVQ